MKTMKLWRYVVALVLLTGSFVYVYGQASSGQDAPATFPLRGCLLDQDGLPVADSNVLLLCVTPHHMVTPEQAARIEHYHTTTDEQGRFTFVMGRFESPVTSTSDWEKQTPFPGWGVYHLWSAPEALAGAALSPPIVSMHGNHSGKFYSSGLQDAIQLETLTDELPLRLRPLRSLEGTIEAIDGAPLADQLVSVAMALHAGTPNPAQYRLELARTQTDSSGRFFFEGLYPATVLLDLGDAPPYWIQTRLPGETEWAPERLATFDLSRSGQTAPIRIMATHEPEFTMSGQIRDEDGRPLADATVKAAPVDMKESRPFMNRINWVTSTTGAEGRYEMKTGYGWLSRIEVDKPGYTSIHEEGGASANLPVKAYDFTLQRQKAMELTGLVLDAAGQPATGRPVLLVNMQRHILTNLDRAAELPNFHTQTGSDGRFRFVLGEYASFREPEPDDLPPFGEYYVVVPPMADDAGAISVRLIHAENPQPGRYRVPARAVGSSPDPVELRLARGIKVSGHVVDLDEEGQANIKVSLHHDLHARTHTGHGGEIWERTVLTDEQGYFSFEKVYPGEFLLNVDAPWISTRIESGHDWQAGPRDHWQRDEDPGDVSLDIMINRDDIYRYEGRVTDEQGNPVEGTTVVVAVSSGSQAYDWSDFHHFLEVQTDNTGHYEYLSPYPWVRLIKARKDGYQDIFVEKPLDQMKPGQYDLQLKRIY